MMAADKDPHTFVHNFLSRVSSLARLVGGEEEELAGTGGDEGGDEMEGYTEESETESKCVRRRECVCRVWPACNFVEEGWDGGGDGRRAVCMVTE